MGCGQTCVKAGLIAVNVIFFLAGAAILGAGFAVRFLPDLQNYITAIGLDLGENDLYKAAYVLIGFGGLTFLVGFLGCCGAIQKSKLLIGLYVTFVALILIGEVIGTAVIYLNKDKVIGEIETKVSDFINEQYTNEKTSAADIAWNEVMKALKCCGVRGPDEFLNSNSTTNYKLPESCCKWDMDKDDYIDEAACIASTTNNTNSEFVNDEGCSVELQNFFKDNSTLLLGVGIGVAGFELLVIIVGIFFACNIDDK